MDEAPGTPPWFFIPAGLPAAPANTADAGLAGRRRPSEVRPSGGEGTLESKEKQLHQSGVGADA